MDNYLHEACEDSNLSIFGATVSRKLPRPLSLLTRCNFFISGYFFNQAGHQNFLLLIIIDWSDHSVNLSA